MEPFLPDSFGVTKSVKIKNYQSIRMEILQETVKVIQCMLIEIYGCIGSKFIEEVEKYRDQVKLFSLVLLTYLSPKFLFTVYEYFLTLFLNCFLITLFIFCQI